MRRIASGAVGLLTCAEFPDLSADDRLLQQALIGRGIDTRALVWDDQTVDWSAYAVCVIRSTWDYHLRRAEFLAWVTRASAATELWNHPDLLAWNSHKTYLGELARRGVRVVPSAWVSAGDRLDLRALLAARGWRDVVIKPTVSLNSYGTGLFTSTALDAAQQHLDTLLAARDVMIQPFMRAVQTYGERSLLYIAGRFTHAVIRTPPAWQASGGDVPDDTQHPLTQGNSKLVTPTNDELALAEQVLRAVGRHTLYARVDVVRDDAGETCLLELELVEPSLFLDYAPQAVEQLAAAIVVRTQTDENKPPRRGERKE